MFYQTIKILIISILYFLKIVKMEKWQKRDTSRSHVAFNIY